MQLDFHLTDTEDAAAPLDHFNAGLLPSTTSALVRQAFARSWFCCATGRGKRSADFGAALLGAGFSSSCSSCPTRYAGAAPFSFQARGFYEKVGYTVFGRLDDCPPGHSRFYMQKPLTRQGSA